MKSKEKWNQLGLSLFLKEKVALDGAGGGIRAPVYQ